MGIGFLVLTVDLSSRTVSASRWVEKRPPAERAVARAAKNVAEGIDAEPECQGTLVSKAINREVGGERDISACSCCEVGMYDPLTIV